MVQGGMTIVRYITFAFNFIFVICGIALIVVGALANKEGKHMTVFLGSRLPAASILVIIAGCVVLGIAFLGCCGALKESYCMLMTFSVLLLLMFIIELAAGITAFIFRNKIEEEVKKNMWDSLPKYNSSKNVADTWDYIQKNFECCGVNSSADWEAEGMEPPKSCCKKSKDPCSFYDEGCFDKLEKSVKSRAVQLAVAAIIIAVIQFLGLIFGCCLANAIKKEYETV